MPFLLDQQWHAMHLQRRHNNLLVHVDQHVVQQRLNISQSPMPHSATLWLIINGSKDIRVEDLRIYEQSIERRLEQPMPWLFRPWRPMNSISLDEHLHSYLHVPLHELICGDCRVQSIRFQFRTHRDQGVLLFAPLHHSSESVDRIESRTELIVFLAVRISMRQIVT
jgi:hypothetical protein